MPTEIISLINGALKLVTIILEGIPAEQRQANATVWFFMWWPLGKRILKRAGFSDTELEQIETNVKGNG